MYCIMTGAAVVAGGSLLNKSTLPGANNREATFHIYKLCLCLKLPPIASYNCTIEIYGVLRIHTIVYIHCTIFTMGLA